MSAQTAALKADIGLRLELPADGETQDLAVLADLGLRLELSAHSAGLSATVAQAVETDTAQAIAWAPKLRIVGQIAEADLAQVVTARKTQTLGQALETDLAQALTARKTRTLGQAVETDLAQATARLKSKTIVQAAETDLAQAIAARKTKILGQAAETDLAQPVTRLTGIAVELGQASEGDAAQSITVEQSQAQPQQQFTDGGAIGRRIYRRVAGRIGRVRPYEERDSFARLSAWQAPAPSQAIAAGYAEIDRFAGLCASCHAQIVALEIVADNEIPRARARRGLPARAVLDWFMREAA